MAISEEEKRRIEAEAKKFELEAKEIAGRLRWLWPSRIVQAAVAGAIVAFVFSNWVQAIYHDELTLLKKKQDLAEITHEVHDYEDQLHKQSVMQREGLRKLRLHFDKLSKGNGSQSQRKGFAAEAARLAKQEEDLGAQVSRAESRRAKISKVRQFLKGGH